MASGRRDDEHASKFEQPYVLAEGLHWFALYKPPFWQVSVGSSEEEQVSAATSPEDEEDADEEDETLA